MENQNLSTLTAHLQFVSFIVTLDLSANLLFFLLPCSLLCDPCETSTQRENVSLVDSLLCLFVTQCRPLYLLLQSFGSSVHLLNFCPLSMPLNVGDSWNPKCPLLTVGVSSLFHIVDVRTRFSEPFHTPNPSLRKGGKKEQPKLPELSLLQAIPEYFTPKHPKEKKKYTLCLDLLEEGLVLGSSPPPV